MRVWPVLLVAMASLLAGSNATATVSTTRESSQANTEVSKVSSLNAEPTVRSLSDGDTRKKSLRGKDESEDVEDENEEERAGGTEIAMWAHGLAREDAKIVRQIAKQNSPEHILRKIGAPFEIVNGHKVFSIHDPKYQKYLQWLIRYRDDLLTFP
ncbi:hypothetical protein PRNP1_004918 [Phytophthora ramorum]